MTIAGTSKDLLGPVDVRDELEFLELANRLGWGDGLPLIIPSEDRVAAALAHCAFEPQDSLGAVPPFGGEATYEKLAVNFVMAGCPPELFPVACTAMCALLAAPFNLYAVQATTSPATPFILVNGPWRHALGFNYLSGAMGPGNRANATLGRFVRLAMNNLGGGRASSLQAAMAGDVPCLDHSTHGFPAKYTFCCAENEEASPWDALHVEQAGLEPGDDAVTVFAVDSFENIRDQASKTAVEYGTCLAAAMRRWGSSNLVNGGYPILVLSPDQAALLASANWSKADVRKFLFERARVDMRELPESTRELHLRRRPSWVDIARVPVTNRPDDLGLAVVGGRGIHAELLSTFGSSHPVTARVIRDDTGRFAGAEIVVFDPEPA
jgi:hypothetical protein